MNILNEILELIEYERLIEEGKDPIEVLRYKFKNVPENIIDKTISIDPTKKKSYSQWLLSKWNDERNVIVDNLKNGRIAKLFQHYKNHDDVQIKDCPSVSEGLRMFVPEEDTVLTKSDKPMTYVENLHGEVDSDLANDFDIVFNEDNWLIAVPNTYEAECKLGENMHWCTANAFGNGRSYYEKYLEDGGKYYVNFDMSHGESRNGKDYPFTRYQFHFESKQFKDKEDDSVNLGDIGMPESAKDYYINEGYNEEDFEDLEEKMERYEEMRNSVSWQINDELILGIEYDEDFEFQEPDENTDYYLFDLNDDRDPICWDALPNPSNESPVILERNKHSEYLVLATKENYDLAAIKQVNYSRYNYYRDWETETFEKWIELPGEVGVFGLNTGGKYVVLTALEKTETNVGTKECENMFINQECMNKDEWKRVFIETVADGYHSLFTIDYDNDYRVDCIIKRDIPANGKQYVIDEQENIVGKYYSYLVYDDGNEKEQYHFAGELTNGNYIISMTVLDDYGRTNEYFNVTEKGSKKPLLDEWVNVIAEQVEGDGNLYVTKKSGLFGYFNANGKQVGQWYKHIGRLDAEKGIVYGEVGDRFDTKQLDLVDACNGVVFSNNFKQILTQKSVNNKIVVRTAENSAIGYDYVERKPCYPEFKNMIPFQQYESDLFFCDVDGSEGRSIFDFSTQQVILTGITKMSQIRGKILKIFKVNGKQNIFDYKEVKTLLPVDVDEVQFVDTEIATAVVIINGKYHVYNYGKGFEITNPNGTDIPVTITSRGGLAFSNGYGSNEAIFFDILDNGSAQLRRWYDYERNINGETIDANTPQNIRDLYYKIIGQQPSVSETFRRFLKRINEVKI